MQASSETISAAHMALFEQVHGSLLDAIKQTVRDHDKQRKEVVAEFKALSQEWKKSLAAFDKVPYFCTAYLLDQKGKGFGCQGRGGCESCL